MHSPLLQALLAAACLSACWSPRVKVWSPIGPADQERHGSFTYQGGLSATLGATVRALRAEGFELALINEDKGLVVTKPKLLQVEASARVASAGYLRLNAQATEVQIRAELLAEGPFHVKVKLIPAAYLNGSRADRVEWNYVYLRRTWSAILGRIYEALPRHGDIGTPPRPLPRARPQRPSEAESF